jgi:streptomycin 6-kinase
MLSLRLQLDSTGLTRLQRIYTKITDYDPKVIHRRLSARKAANTNRWLLDRDDFQSWLHGDVNSQSYLWLSGKGRKAIRPYGIGMY